MGGFSCFEQLSVELWDWFPSNIWYITLMEFINHMLYNLIKIRFSDLLIK